jgi:hypothetical protein
MAERTSGSNIEVKTGISQSKKFTMHAPAWVRTLRLDIGHFSYPPSDWVLEHLDKDFQYLLRVLRLYRFLRSRCVRP